MGKGKKLNKTPATSQYPVDSHPSISPATAALIHRIEENKLQRCKALHRPFVGQSLLDALDASLGKNIASSSSYDQRSPAASTSGKEDHLQDEKPGGASIDRESRKGSQGASADLSGKGSITKVEVQVLYHALAFRRRLTKTRNLVNADADNRLLSQLRFGTITMSDFEDQLASSEKVDKYLKLKQEELRAKEERPPTQKEVDAKAHGRVPETKKERRARRKEERRKAASTGEVANSIEQSEEAVDSKPLSIEDLRAKAQASRREKRTEDGVLQATQSADSTRRVDLLAGASSSDYARPSNHGLGTGLWPLPELNAIPTPIGFDSVILNLSDMHLPNKQKTDVGNIPGPRRSSQIANNQTQPVPYDPRQPLLNLPNGHSLSAFNPLKQGPFFPKGSSNPRAGTFNPVSSLHKVSETGPFNQFACTDRQTQNVTPNRPYSVNSRSVSRSLSAEPGSDTSMKSSSRGRRSSPLIHLPAPVPSAAYMTQALQKSHRLPVSQPLLILSDLNGTLIYRRNRSTSFSPRPGLSGFLASTFGSLGSSDPKQSPNKFMIWTSSRPQTASAIVKQLLNHSERNLCIAIWARDTLGLAPQQYSANVQVYKRMESVWRNQGIQATHPYYKRGERWSQRNTLLIDDSYLKAAAQPYNLVQIPELTAELLKDEQKRGEDGTQTLVLAQLAAYIDAARWYADVSCFVRENPFRIDAGWGMHSDIEPLNNVQKEVEIPQAKKDPGIA